MLFLPQLSAWRRSSRVEANDLATDIAAVLSRPEAYPSLLSATQSKIEEDRVAAFAFLAETRHIEATTVHRALKDPSTVVRKWGVRLLLLLKPSEGQSFRELISFGLKFSEGTVRSRCLELLGANDTEETRAVIREFLLDRSPTVRQASRDLSTRWKVVDDYASFYLAHLKRETPSTIRKAIHALAEIGHKDAWPRIVPFLASEDLGVRFAAMRAGDALADEFEWLWQALENHHELTSRLAARILTAGSRAEPSRALGVVFGENKPTHARLNALGLTHGYSKWRRAICWLKGTLSANDLVRSQALKELAVWLSRYNSYHGVKPTAQELAEFDNALLLARPFLLTEVADALEFSALVWRRSHST